MNGTSVYHQGRPAKGSPMRASESKHLKIRRPNMRDIQIKNSVSANHRRKYLSILETIQKDGMMATAEKKFSYYVCEKNSPGELGSFTPSLGSDELPYQKKDRHVSIKKIYDQTTGMGKMIYRVIGSFYVMYQLRVFAVVFMHTIKFDILSENFVKGKV